ncbi:MAG: hypothetical protein IEMM0006_1882 [bacterium]|nr:MAG: hypothetical protein IEMM0006_1882 [bacterium]
MKQKRHEYKFRLEAIVLAQVNRARNSRTRLAPVSEEKQLSDFCSKKVMSKSEKRSGMFSISLDIPVILCHEKQV